jgi:hypothetical protein
MSWISTRVPRACPTRVSSWVPLSDVASVGVRDLPHLRDVEDHQFAIAHAACAARVGDGLEDLFHAEVIDIETQFDFGQEGLVVFGCRIAIERALLTTEAFDFGDLEGFDGGESQRVQELLHQIGTHDGNDMLHDQPILANISRTSEGMAGDIRAGVPFWGRSGEAT